MQPTPAQVQHQLPRELQEELCRIYLQWDNASKKDLSHEEREGLARLATMPEGKALFRLIDNIVVDLQNKVFRESETLEDFKAVKWAVRSMTMLKAFIIQTYNFVTKKGHEVPKANPDLESIAEEPGE